MSYTLQVVVCEGLEVKYRTTLVGPLKDIDEAHDRVRHMKELTPGELIRIFDAAENWDKLQTAIIQKSLDGKEWTALNVMNAIEAEKKLKAVKDWIIPKEFFPVTVEEIDELKKILEKDD